MNKDCNCGNDCQNNVETAYIGDIDVDTLATLPDYLIAERDVEDPATGSIKRTVTRIPTERIVPNGNYDNIVTIAGNNPAITTVPEGQVIGAYVKNELSKTTVQLASAANPAQFLIVGTLPDGQLLIQPTGVVSIPGTHKYIIGIQYYQGDNGQPTTDATSDQKLFFPISDTQLLINL